ncbi:unnamed protein product [Camellia sinensis]
MVTFLALERLQIKRLTKIWDKKLLPSESFRQLRNVTIRSCEKLVNVGSSNMPRQLPKLEQLEVAFPVFEYLDIQKLPNIIDMGQAITHSFRKRIKVLLPTERYDGF